MLIDEMKALMSRGSTSFAELAKLEGFEGEFGIASEGNENVVYWVNMSQEAVDAIMQIRAEGEYKMVPAPLWVYAVDGRLLTMPRVTGDYRYKKPHWLPVVFNPVKKEKRRA